MNRIVIVAIAATVAVALAIAMGPWALIPLAVFAVFGGRWWFRQGRPIGPASPSCRGLRWIAAGIVGLGIAVLIPAIDGGELNEFWWTVMAALLLAGIAMTIIGMLLFVGGRSDRPSTATVR